MTVQFSYVEEIIEACGDDRWNDFTDFFPEYGHLAVDAWQHEVEAGDTRLGYWEWVLESLQE